MMIGYIINMEPISILTKVNEYLPNQFPKLSFSFTQKVVSSEQEYFRLRVEPEEFKIIHIWVNLKN